MNTLNPTTSYGVNSTTIVCLFVLRMVLALNNPRKLISLSKETKTSQANNFVMFTIPSVHVIGCAWINMIISSNTCKTSEFWRDFYLCNTLEYFNFENEVISSSLVIK